MKIWLVVSAENNFQKGENKGRKLFKNFTDQAKNVSNVIFESDEYSPIDCTYIINDMLVVGEIKVRDEYCENYDTLIFEKKKYDAMRNKVNELKAAGAVYINYIGDNILYLFNIDRINNRTCKLESKGCKRTTAEYSGYTKKDVYLVPKSLGIRYEFDGEKWKKSA